jgi:V/A-type H+-transporting ATPase subunit E
MTGTEKIKEKILYDARSRANSIEEQAKKEAQEILDKASYEAGLRKEAVLKEAENDGMETYKRMLAVAGLEGRKETLRTKQDAINAAFQMALDKVCSLPDREYQRLLEDMIVKAAVDGGGEIFLSQKDAPRMDKNFISNINQRVGSSGKSGAWTLSPQPVKTVGGFILKSGEMEINSTFEIMFGMLRTELEGEVVKILFNS